MVAGSSPARGICFYRSRTLPGVRIIHPWPAEPYVETRSVPASSMLPEQVVVGFQINEAVLLHDPREQVFRFLRGPGTNRVAVGKGVDISL
ncbi:MAG: hypothetical protein OXR72_19975 [Gemmatimonadota bacterium]|nr:hypothetical protein [Gemmatimonadota bacterium]